MNEFERRWLEITENREMLKAIVAALGSSAVVEDFGYVVELGSIAAPLTAGVTVQKTIATRADSWFVVQYISSAVILPNGSTNGDLSQFTDPGNINLLITDTGAGKEIYNAAGPAGILTGTANAALAGIPLLLPTPRPIPPNTNITVEATQIGFTALENPAPVGFYLMLNGARISIV